MSSSITLDIQAEESIKAKLSRKNTKKIKQNKMQGLFHINFIIQ